MSLVILIAKLCERLIGSTLYLVELGWLGEAAMTRTVLKFGGTSVADLDRIAHVADLVAYRAAKGEKLAVIVSAMAGETNKLVSLARGAAGSDVIGDEFDDEYDVVVASGEQVTSGLLALALRRRGLKARRWLGWQMRMKTREGHGAMARSLSSQAFRALLRMAGSQHSDVAGLIRQPLQWLPRSAPFSVTSIPMSTGSTRLIHGSTHMRVGSTGFLMKRCSKWRLSAQRFCRPDL